MNSHKPNKYESIQSHIEMRIRNGSIRPGSKLPSIREMSEQFGCSKNTVIRAYDELVRSRLVYSVDKSGFYAMQRPSDGNENAKNQIDFTSAAPARDAMPYQGYLQCLNRATELYHDELFQYTDPQGFRSLRIALSKHFAASQVFADPDQICIVSGAQQALHLLTAMPFPNGKTTILAEQPTYSGMVRVIGLSGSIVIGTERTCDGLNLEEVERHFRDSRVKFFYCISRFHNPLGTSLHREQKECLAKLAAKYNVYIVEDDYLGDLETDPKSDPIFSRDMSEHTVYLRSFSKVMLPGLRLAAAVLPKPLLPAFRDYKSACDLGTSALSQAALEIYLTCGMFARHTASMRERYKARMKAVQAACHRELPPEIGAVIPSAGIFSRLALPDQLPAQPFAAKLKERGIHVMPTDHCYLPSCQSGNGIRISVIRTDENQIAEGIRIIAEAAAERLNHRPPGAQIIDWI